MKKIIAIMLVLVMLVGTLASCKSEEGNGSESASGSSMLNNWWNKWTDAVGNGDSIDGDFDDDDDGDGFSGDNSWNPRETGGSRPSGSYTESIKETDIYGATKFESAVPANPEMEVIDLVVAYRDDLRYSREWFSVDGATDELSAPITIRNDTVNKMLDTNIQYKILGDGDYETCVEAYIDVLVNDVLSGSHQYDIIAGHSNAIARAEVRDVICNLADKTMFPYFDFSLPCWNQTLVKNTKVNGKLYYVTGDMNLSTIDSMIVTFVNKKLYNEKKQATDPEDIQDVAIEGKWDYEEMYKWSVRWSDFDNNGENDCTDRHGISAAFDSTTLDAIPAAWDLEFVKTSSSDKHSYNIIGNAKIYEAITKVTNLFDERVSEGVINGDDPEKCSLGSGFSEPIIHFVNDRAVFTVHKLYASEDDNMAMRNMASEYGLLPVPKYDKSQTNYGTIAHESYTLVAVLDHSKCDKPTYGKAVSAWLQISNEVSYTDVYGYYINRIVKPHYFGCNDANGTVTKSIKIFNMICDNVEFDFATVYSPQLNQIMNTCWRDAVMEETTAEDVYVANKDTFDAELAALDERLAQ